MNVFEKHQLAIARKTLRMPDEIVAILGGMTKQEAADVINRLVLEGKLMIGKKGRESPND